MSSYSHYKNKLTHDFSVA